MVPKGYQNEAQTVQTGTQRGTRPKGAANTEPMDSKPQKNSKKNKSTPGKKLGKVTPMDREIYKKSIKSDSTKMSEHDTQQYSKIIEI